MEIPSDGVKTIPGHGLSEICASQLTTRLHPPVIGSFGKSKHAHHQTKANVCLQFLHGNVGPLGETARRGVCLSLLPGIPVVLFEHESPKFFIP